MPGSPPSNVRKIFELLSRPQVSRQIRNVARNPESLPFLPTLIQATSLQITVRFPVYLPSPEEAVKMPCEQKEVT